MKPPLNKMRISVDLKTKTLLFIDSDGKEKISTKIVHGDPTRPLLTGTFTGKEWQVNKTNDEFKIPHSQNCWANPYGPYYLKIHDRFGNYTTTGIHGTKGPTWSPFVSPPEVLEPFLPKKIPNEFLNKTLGSPHTWYHSRGCIRIPNTEITKLYNLTKWRGFLNIEIKITN
jgi:lipoprotein-anchoring transpeptidase ErfK/SrfK